MRFIIYGLGAIGGVFAAKLALNHEELVGIARGAQLDAVRTNGLTLRTPDGDLTARFPVVGHPREIAFREDDVIILSMKSQHTEDALRDLRAAGVRRQAIVCAQNGVENENMALRFFDTVIAMLVLMPADFVSPGEVAAFGQPRHGLFDIGRYPSGDHPAIDALCESLNACGFAAYRHDTVMRAKYGKLLINLGNAVDAAMGNGADAEKYVSLAREEALAVYAAAGIGFDDVGQSDPRRAQLMQIKQIPGTTRVGSSSAQSLARSAGSTEIDYLNGEIVRLGRLHGVPTPVNAFFTDLSARLAAENARPGSLSGAEIDAQFAAWQAG